MEWRKLFSMTTDYTCIRDEQFDSQRTDINSNTSDCSKLLYRLEEAEVRITGLETSLEVERLWRNDHNTLRH